MHSRHIAPYRGKGSGWHFHDEIELTLVTGGQGTQLIGDHISRFTAPKLALFGPNLPHCWHFDGRSSGLSIQLSTPRILAMLPPDERRELEQLSERAAKGIELFGNSLKRATNQLDDIMGCSGVARIGAVLKLIGGISQTQASELETLSTMRFDVSRLVPAYASIQSAIQVILSRFREPLMLEDILAEAHMSKANFSRRFTAYTGKTYTVFLNEVRIGYASHKLAETADAISDIAFASGFNNLAHFNRMFRRHRSISPSENRAQLREATELE
jgi:AraC-like DNA-binding protein